MADLHSSEAFAYKLRKLVDRSGYSIRALGKAVDPTDPERGRRRVQRHLSGKHLPSRASRDAYAEALGVDESELPLPDDDADRGITREERLEFRRLAMKLLEAVA